MRADDLVEGLFRLEAERDRPARIEVLRPAGDHSGDRLVGFAADQLDRHRGPGGIGNDRLALAAAQGEDVELAVLAADQAAEDEAAGGARDEDVAIERAGERVFPILQPLPEPGASLRRPHAARADAAFIRTLLRTRRLRTHFFRSDLFADPAWDMLLDLMAARLEGKQVAVSSLCIAAAVPPTTALRWIGVLTEGGLVARVADRNDGRRVYIELAEPTVRALTAWLDEARRMLADAC